MRSKIQVSKKILSVLLCVLVVFSCVPMSVISVSAEGASDITVIIDTGTEVTIKDTNRDTYYEISTADELYAFAYAVNGVNTSINAKLTADIVVNDGTLSDKTDKTMVRHWTPIGKNSGNRYNGIFDGNGKTISGLYFNNKELGYIGLFGSIYEQAVVKNTGVINSYLNGYKCVAGLVGDNVMGTITNCYNTSEVDGKTKIGGVAGYNSGTITNCYNSGDLGINSSYVGGIVGENRGTIKNCYNTGMIRGRGDIGGVVGYDFNSHKTIADCYYLTGTCVGGSCSRDIAGSAEPRTAEQFASGEIAYLLQSNVIADENGEIPEIWGQDITTGDNDTTVDNYPVLGGDKVYYGFLSCADNDNSYTNDPNEPSEKIHDTFNDNGFCICDSYEPAKLNDNYTADDTTDDYYEIDNAGKLYWFAEQVNSGKTSINAKLTANIVINNGTISDKTDSTKVRHWTPIGNLNNKYAGTFNGNGKTVSGLYFNDSNVQYVGLFGYIKNGNVENVGVINSYFNGKFFIGGIVGYNISGTINNCYSTGNVSGAGYIGGITGYDNSSTITNCYNKGVVSGGHDIGGIAGYTDSDTITNCYNSGNVNGSEDSVGGIAGYSNAKTYTNCYYMATSETDKLDGTTFKTKDQFVNGEVAYLLQSCISENEYGYIPDVWGQIIGTDAFPKFTEYHTVYIGKNCKGETAYTNIDTEYYEVTLHSNFDDDGLCTDCKNGYKIPAVEIEENGWSKVYLISNACELLWLQDFVNSGIAGDCSAKLTADINLNEGFTFNSDGTYTSSIEGANLREWTPINNMYGNFDGNGHTISGIYCVAEYDNVGLFGYDSTWNITNLTIANSYFEGNSNVGAISGYGGYVNYAGCVVKEDVTVKGENRVGGIAGYIDNSNQTTNCMSLAKIICDDGVYGGIAGYNCSAMSNCYTTTEIFVGSHSEYYGNGFTNCYYVSDTETAPYKGLHSITASAVTSGELAYQLQAGVKGEEIYDEESGEYITAEPKEIWGQKLGEDNYPVLGGNKVYYGYIDCNATEKTYCNNAAYDEIPTHNFENGKCTICGDKAPAVKLVSITGDIALALEETDTNIFTGVVELQAGKYSFNIEHNGTKLGFNYTYTDTATIDYSAGYKAPTKLNATGGRYTFTYNASTKVLRIKYKNFADIVELFGDINVELVRISADSTVFTGSSRVEAGSYTFKINNKGTEMGFKYSFNDVVYGVQYGAGWSATTFNATGGIYSVSYDTATNKLTLKHAPKGLGDVRVFGDINVPLAGQGNNIYSAQTTLEAGTYQFRVDALGTTVCNGSEFTNTMNGIEYKTDWKAATTFIVPEKQKFTFIFDTNTNKIKIFNSPIDTTKVLVAFENLSLELKSTDGVNYTATTSLDAGTYTFRMDEFGVTMGYGGTYTDEISSIKYNASYSSATTFTANGGNYTFSYNVNTDVLKVTKV